MRKVKNYFLVILIFIIIGFVFIGPYLYQNLPFVYGGDLQPQWYFFYKEIQNLLSISAILEHLRFPFYSWDLFLGNNFWASKAYYGLSDIFNYITLYLPVHFYTVFEIQVVLKITVAGFSFFLLAKEWKDNFKSNLLVSFSYALSAWMIYYIGQLTFASFYALFPLYVLGIEKYYRKNQFILYIISSALLLLTNFYLFFSLVFFTVFYTIYRYYIINNNFKDFIKKTSILLFYAMISVLITGIVIYPSLLYILGNDRVGQMKLFFSFEEIRIYLHQIISFVLPSHLVIYQDNPFDTVAHNTREILFWSGSVSALLLPQIFTDKDRYFKKASIILYGLLFIIFLLPIGDSLMHGLSQSSFRWLYFFILINLFIAHRYLSNIEIINKRTLKITIVSIFSLMIIVYLSSIGLDLGLNHILDYPKTTFAFLFSMLGIFIAFITLLKNPKYSLVILLLLTVSEMTYAGYLNLVDRRLNPSRTWDFENRVTHVLQDYPEELNSYLNNLEPSNSSEYYRIYVPQDSLYWSYSHNMSVAYGIQGLMTYDSTYASSFNDLKIITDEVKAFNSDWLFDIQNDILVNFLNTKYAIVLDESDLPHSNFTLIEDGYREAFKIYRNNLYRPLGTMYTDIIDYETYESFYQNDLSMLETTIIAYNDDLSKIQGYLGNSNEIVWNAINHYDNHLDGSFMTKSEGFMVLTLPYDNGWIIRINGTPVESFQVNGGFIGIPVEKGENILEMDFVPQGFKEGAIITALGLLLFAFIFTKQFLLKKLIRK